MRRSRVLASAMSGALLLTMVSALSVQAGGPSATNTVYRATCVVDYSHATYWESGATFHQRGVVDYHVNFFLIDGAWAAAGTNVTTTMVDGTLDRTTTTLSGKFEVRDSPVGDYDGSWALGAARGTAAGQGVGDSAGMHLKSEMLRAKPAGLPARPADPCGNSQPPLRSGYELWEVH